MRFIEHSLIASNTVPVSPIAGSKRCMKEKSQVYTVHSLFKVDTLLAFFLELVFLVHDLLKNTIHKDI